MATKVIGTRQLRDELALLIEETRTLEGIVITQRGQGRAVLVDIERYNDLVDRLEYLEDSLDAVGGERAGAVPLAELS